MKYMIRIVASPESTMNPARMDTLRPSTQSSTKGETPMNCIIQVQVGDGNWKDLESGYDNLDDAMQSYNRIRVDYRTVPTRLILIMDSEN